MNSLDTNILLYALNSGCPEHIYCRRLIDRALSEKGQWIVAEQVWFELYRLLRNKAVLENPLDPKHAADVIAWYRNRSGWLHCSWETDMMEELDKIWRGAGFPGRNGFDAVLAVTLKAHGVDTFYTRNIMDFSPFGFFTLIDPIT
jgi:toxin-antitoxin system PIN domain toxin